MPSDTTQLQTVGGNYVTVLKTAASGLTYVEMFTPEYSESLREGASEATRICLCQWIDRQQFYEDMLGTVSFKDGNMVAGVQTNLQRLPPEPHPTLPNLYAMDIEFVGYGVPTKYSGNIAQALSSSVDYSDPSSDTMSSPYGEILFNMARAKVTYRAPDYLVYGDGTTPGSVGELGRFIIKKSQIQGENLSIPGNAFKFVGSTSPIPESPTKTFTSEPISYLWKGIPAAYVDYTNQSNQYGTVNQYLFDGQYPPGCLLLTGIDRTYYWSASLQRVCDITFTWLYRNLGNSGKGWNYLLRRDTTTSPATLDFQEASVDPGSGSAGIPYPEPNTVDGVHIYDSSDHRLLFILPTTASVITG
jgi:hypothetical protein